MYNGFGQAVPAEFNRYNSTEESSVQRTPLLSVWQTISVSLQVDPGIYPLTSITAFLSGAPLKANAPPTAKTIAAKGNTDFKILFFIIVKLIVNDLLFCRFSIVPLILRSIFLKLLLVLALVCKIKLFF